jgi:hypothetical protein
MQTSTIVLMVWNQRGTRGLDPALAGLECSQAMDKTK